MKKIEKHGVDVAVGDAVAGPPYRDPAGYGSQNPPDRTIPFTVFFFLPWSCIKTPSQAISRGVGLFLYRLLWAPFLFSETSCRFLFGLSGEYYVGRDISPRLWW